MHRALLTFLEEVYDIPILKKRVGVRGYRQDLIRVMGGAIGRVMSRVTGKGYG
jgi:hypothetical protein